MLPKLTTRTACPGMKAGASPSDGRAATHGAAGSASGSGTSVTTSCSVAPVAQYPPASTLTALPMNWLGPSREPAEASAASCLGSSRVPASPLSRAPLARCAKALPVDPRGGQPSPAGRGAHDPSTESATPVWITCMFADLSKTPCPPSRKSTFHRFSDASNWMTIPSFPLCSGLDFRFIKTTCCPGWNPAFGEGSAGVWPSGASPCTRSMFASRNVFREPSDMRTFQRPC
mmetsp:Transcript_20205/g.55739  ORF Transcript_20205/g.55739 Transcript_20205/m.55739 type:complete len:231 (-) Transcript_20205:1677-2369(-)